MFHETDNLAIDERLRTELQAIAVRIRQHRWHRRAALAWNVAAVMALGLSVLGGWFHLTALAAWFGALAVASVCIVYLVFAWRRERLDFRTAASLVERAHPDLAQALLTALGQTPEPSGHYTFLQRQVISEALRHAFAHDWTAVRVGPRALPQLAHVAALCFFFAATLTSIRLPSPTGDALFIQPTPTISIMPGNMELERGSTVVISARFENAVPVNVTLEWTADDGRIQLAPMSRSLSDPVFAYTLAEVSRDVEYRVRFNAEESQTHRLSVFDLPALVQADATLHHPAYTGLDDRIVTDTRRVSAVEGSHVEFELQLNKPVARAEFHSPEGDLLKLEPIDIGRTRFATTFDLAESKRFVLHLEDDAGRSNKRPPEFRIEALPNKTPNLTLRAPRGDIRVTALEEVLLEGGAADDFGLLDWGLGYAVGADSPRQISLGDEGNHTHETTFQHLLALEEHDLTPGDLVAWYAWAQDYGPNGEPRTTNSDLFFGEVRPFDEVFRESEDGQAGQPPGQGQRGSEDEQLLEIQRQISIAIWKLRQRPPHDQTRSEDIGATREAQDSARQMLERQRERIRDEELRRAADEASGFMDTTGRKLAEALAPDPAGALTEAWQNSQGAYQALLRLVPEETRVGRTRGGGQAGASRSQRQLNRLRFRDSDDAYETETEAQALTSPEEREQLETISRLRELARRQQDVNDRLQELQTALQAAEDEAERERIQRELKRLEEEQRRMVADLDEVRNRLNQQRQDTGSRQAGQRLDQTREDMQRSNDALREGSVSEALASGTRARERLEETRDELRRNNSSRFSEEMRQLKRQATELAENQAASGEQLDTMDAEGLRSLDDTTAREEIASNLTQRRADLEALLDEIQRVTEAAENSEPGLYRQLYDTLRDFNQGSVDDRLETSVDLLRRGFVDQARELQPGITRALDQLQREIDEAAEYVLGDETSTMRFAQQELDDLGSELARDRPAAEERDGDSAEGRRGQQDPAATSQENGDQSALANIGPSGSGATDELTRALEEIAGAGRSGDASGGPLTGGGYGEWADRLRTVESLLESEDARERIAGARQIADSLRGEYRRQGELPQWNLVESGIAAPLSEVRAWLRQELARIEDPTSLNPADRDPVPERFTEAVQRYYETLSQ